MIKQFVFVNNEIGGKQTPVLRLKDEGKFNDWVIENLILNTTA